MAKLSVVEIFNKLKLNPNNPRNISKQKFEKLKKSILEFPKMLDLRPIIYDSEFIILGGNMRFQALQELVKDGFKIKESYFRSADTLTEEEKKRFITLDNLEFGEWDYNLLAREFEANQLLEWGFESYQIGLPDEKIDFTKEWINMPEFEQQDLTGCKTLLIHFRNEDDLKSFAALLQQNITSKTRSIWFPKKKRETSMEFIDES